MEGEGREERNNTIRIWAKPLQSYIPDFIAIQENAW